MEQFNIVTPVHWQTKDGRQVYGAQIKGHLPQEALSWFLLLNGIKCAPLLVHSQISLSADQYALRIARAYGAQSGIFALTSWNTTLPREEFLPPTYTSVKTGKQHGEAVISFLAPLSYLSTVLESSKFVGASWIDLH